VLSLLGRLHPTHTATVLFGALVAFLIVRPYHGLVHDGIVYSAQTLFWAYPDVFRHDLFFAAGAQHDFSVFSRFAGVYLKAGGALATLGKALALLGCTAWLLGFWYLGGALVTRKIRAVLLVALVAVVPVYGGGTGGDWLLHFAEPHFTPRIWAEALCLMAVGAALRRAHWAVVLALSAAASLHILVAAGGIAIVLMVSVLRARSVTQRQAFAGIGVLAVCAVLGLAAVDKAPFSMLFARYDGLWWNVVSEVNDRLVFPTRWGSPSWSALLWSMTAQLVALSVAHSRLRVFLVAVLAAQMAGFSVAILLGDVGRNALILSLQLWRVQWLGQVAGAISLGYLAWLAVKGRLRWVTAGVFVAQATVGSIVSPLATILAILAWYVGTRQRNHTPSRLAVVVGLLAALGAATVAAKMYAAHRLGISEIVTYTLRGGAAIGLCAFFYTLARWPNVARIAIVAAAIATYSHYWDHRDPGAKEMEGMIGPDTAIGRALPRDAAVVWVDGPLDGPWMILGRASYVDVVHATNALFNREYAEEYARRVMVVKDLYGPLETLNDELIGRVCARDHRLTHVVVPPSDVWNVVQKFQLRLEHRRQGEYWIVACSPRSAS
jgi:hypothetical protein